MLSLHSLDVRQAIPGPRSRVENVTDNLEATALFHQPRGKRIDDGSTVRNLRSANIDFATSKAFL